MTSVTPEGVFVGPPPGYEPPSWPGLGKSITSPNYLYNPYPIWQFVVLWTLIVNGFIFLVVGLLFPFNFAKRHFRLSLVAYAAFVTWGLVGGFIAGTVMGYALAALYNAAYLRMSTFVPPLWAGAQALLLLLISWTTFLGMT